MFEAPRPPTPMKTRFILSFGERELTMAGNPKAAAALAL
jgi:hypothetical protein